jgi:DHA1 family bicyclomycin/chloramphenicol resistance-like MFS transporter
MLQAPATDTARATTGLAFGEFVALIASMMALTALAVDIMLPALGQIGVALRLPEDNDRQLVITFYLLGFAAGQPFFGPLSDRFGRKKPLYAGLLLFAVASVIAATASSASEMFAARALQGFGAAAPRVIGIAIVRDRFAGRGMARVMSFVMMVFIVVPIIAPSIGQGLCGSTPTWTRRAGSAAQ